MIGGARLAKLGGRIGLSGVAMAILAGMLAVQTVRIEGLKVWPLSIEGWKEKSDRLQGDLDAVRDAQKEARQIAELEKAGTEKVYREIAQEIDYETEAELRDQLAVAERFIRAGGMRTQTAGGGSRRAASPSGDHPAGRSDQAGPPAELDGADRTGLPDPAGLVLVTADDVRICTANTIQAEAGRQFALQLKAASAP